MVTLTARSTISTQGIMGDFPSLVKLRFLYSPSAPKDIIALRLWIVFVVNCAEETSPIKI